MIILTGQNGYIGSAAARLFVEAGQELLALHHFPKREMECAPSEDMEHGWVDFKDPKSLSQALQRLVADREVESVVHLGAATAGPAFSRHGGGENAVLTENLLEALTAIQPRSIVFASSSHVYSESQGEGLLDENSPTEHPISTYGGEKLACEANLKEFVEKHKISAVVLRIFTASGVDNAHHDHPSRLRKNLIHELVLGAKDPNASVPIFCSGDQYPLRDFIHVTDIATAIRGVTTRTLNGTFSEPFSVFNVSTGTGTSAQEIIDAIREASGIALQVETRPVPDNYVMHLVSDPTKLKREVGWDAVHSKIDRMVKDYLHFFGLA